MAVLGVFGRKNLLKSIFIQWEWTTYNGVLAFIITAAFLLLVSISKEPVKDSYVYSKELSCLSRGWETRRLVEIFYKLAGYYYPNVIELQVFSSRQTGSFEEVKRFAVVPLEKVDIRYSVKI